MIKITDKSKCSGCHACYSVCPKQCITMQEDDEGFRYPVIDQATCINCHLCENVCPVTHSNESKKVNRAYGAYNTDNVVREKSSSGGIFYLLAKKIIEDGGVVFGAAFNKDFSVEHVMVDSVNDLPKLMTSKYLQSIIGDTYKLVKQQLEADRYVLFTGCTCQIEGLRAYLKKDYDNLYLQDIICHGVPSPKLWQEYLQFLGEEEVKSVNFRAKSPSWKGYSLVINNQRIAVNSNDIYMRSFVRNLNLRPSCYDCAFKKENRNSDITLADFWGSEMSSVKELDDEKGLSMVITHSSKGEYLLSAIKESLIYKEVDMATIIKFNGAYIKSVAKPKNREKYFKEINAKNYKKITVRYTRGHSLRCVLSKVKNTAKMLLKK